MDDRIRTTEGPKKAKSPKKTTQGSSKIKLPKTKVRDVANMCVPVTHKSEPEPETYAEAMRSRNRKEWQKAIDTELMNLKNAGTWEIVDPPQNQMAIRNKSTCFF